MLHKPTLYKLKAGFYTWFKTCKELMRSIGSNRLKKSDITLLQDINIESYTENDVSSVETYWTGHTVRNELFCSKEESLEYLKWREKQYPFYHDLMEIWGNHTGKVIVDYGCGPGNDLVGFLSYSSAAQIIGIDISAKALTLANHRLSLHKDQDLGRIRLMQISETSSTIPLPDKSVDYIYCEGVLHHTTDPLSILKEFNRILRDDGKANIMVYNRQSIWFHLYVAFQKKILEKKYSSLNSEEAFARTTDGENCPISRCYRPEDFLAFVHEAGFYGDFIGGYYSIRELEWLAKYGKAAQNNSLLPNQHKAFLKKLTFNEQGYPLYEGKYAGIGGVYKLKK